MPQNLIIENLSRPDILESAYRKAPEDFEPLLKDALKQHPESETLLVWHARLTHVVGPAQKTISMYLIFMLCLIAWGLTKLPQFSNIDGNWYYPRFVPLIVIGTVVLYFLFCSKSRKTTKLIVVGGMLCSIAYLLFLPNSLDSASIVMALIHLPLVYLSILALSFTSEGWNIVEVRLNYVRYLGEMGILTVLILLGGMVLTVITFSLFDLIDLSIEQWYLENIVVLGLVSSPVVATYLFDVIQNRQSKFASILASVFSPLFLLTILVYLAAAFYQGKSPFTDREFLIIFNGLLLAILALTIFSISGRKEKKVVKVGDYVNASLIVATLVINVTALSAIVFRWTEFGTTVNRIAVTGANLMIFFHLLLLLKRYINHLRTGDGVTQLETSVTSYLPIYTLWSLFVAVVLPVVFRYS